MFVSFKTFQLLNLVNNFLSLAIFCCLAGSLFAYCFFIIRNNTKSYKAQISLLEAQSLRAQMNPHFIYNVLNGIQSVLILKTETEISRYMGHLSNLLRITLDMSKKETISLTEEIDYLKSYIELQKMRLNDQLDYCIDVSFNLKTSSVFIPPLLIQPIVENAILHGIVPSKSKGILVISVNEENNGISITVEDNGVGIEASKKQKKNSKNHHKSYGNKILIQRVALLNRNQNQKIEFKISALHNEHKSSGTRTQLFIPNSILKKLTQKSSPKPEPNEKY